MSSTFPNTRTQLYLGTGNRRAALAIQHEQFGGAPSRAIHCGQPCDLEERIRKEVCFGQETRAVAHQDHIVPEAQSFRRDFREVFIQVPILR